MSAVNTWAGCPIDVRAELSASELITVASIPIWSPFTRSNPLAAPCIPRNMLPPPITMAISTPLPAAALICSAYCPRRTGSMP